MNIAKMHSSAIFFTVATVMTQLPCHAFDCVKSEPAIAATIFYASYREFVHNGLGSPSLSNSLAKLIKANITQNLDIGDVGAIDWDFRTDAQDGEAGREVKVISVRDERDRKVVRLSYSFFISPDAKPVPKQLDIVLIHESNGCWLVNDVRHNGRSISRLLAAGTSMWGRKK